MRESAKKEIVNFLGASLHMCILRNKSNGTFISEKQSEIYLL